MTTSQLDLDDNATYYGQLILRIGRVLIQLSERLSVEDVYRNSLKRTVTPQYSEGRRAA